MTSSIDTRLSRVLIEDGMMSANELEDVMQNQNIFGGTLDTLLLETKSIEERRLALALSDAWSTPPTDVVRFERPEVKAIECIPKSIALALNICPLFKDHEGLHLACTAPLKSDLFFDLSTLLGLACVPHVVPEIRVAQALNHAFSKPPSERLQSLLTQVELARVGERPVFDSDDTTPALGVDALERDTDDPIDWDVVEALAHLVAQDSRSGIAEVVLQYARRFLPFAAVVGVREGALWGWKRSGAVQGAQFDSSTFPLEQSTILTRLVKSPSPFIGKPPEGEDATFFGWLGRRRPWTVLAIPVVVAGRTVAVIYGDGGIRARDFEYLSDLVAFGARVGPAFEALLRARHRAAQKVQSDRSAYATGVEKLRLKVPPIALDPTRTPKVTAWSFYEEQEAEFEDEARSFEEAETGRVVVPMAATESSDQSGPTLKPVGRLTAGASQDSLDRAIDRGFLEWDENPSLSEAASGFFPEIEETPALAASDLLPMVEQADDTKNEKRPAALNNQRLDDAMRDILADSDQELFGELAESNEEIKEEINEGHLPVLLQGEGWESVELQKEFSQKSALSIARQRGQKIELEGKREVGIDIDLDDDIGTPLNEQLVDEDLPELLVHPKTKTSDESDDALPIELGNALPPIELGTPLPPTQPPSYWVPRLLHSQVEIAGAASDALVQIGESALPAIARVFPGNVAIDPFGAGTEPTLPEQLGSVVKTLAGIGPASLKIASQEIESPNRLRRYVATFLFSLFSSPTGFSLLRPRLHDTEPAIQRLAAEALKAHIAEPLFDAEILAHLRSRLESPVYDARSRSVWLLGYFRDPKAVAPLIKQLADTSNPMRFEVSSALRKITLQDYPSKEKAWKKWWNKARYTTRIDWMIEALKGRNEDLRLRAAEELVELTGDNFGYDPKAKKSQRDKAAQRYAQWWKNQQARIG